LRPIDFILAIMTEPDIKIPSQPETIPDDPTPTSTLRVSGMRLAVAISIVTHIVLASVLLAIYLPDASRQVGGSGSAQPDQNRAKLKAPEGFSPSAELSEKNESTTPPRSEVEPTEQNSPPRPVPTTPDGSTVAGEQVQEAIEAAIDTAGRASQSKKLTELERNLSRLEQIASEESVEQIGAKVRDTLGLEPRASNPVGGPLRGSFDHDTAQFQDIVRVNRADGKEAYRCVMIDREGRTMEIEIDPEQGKVAYDTMQMIKRSPLGDAVYRTLVMPMLDRLLAETKGLGNAHKPMTPTNPEAPVDMTQRVDTP
jgi:hypothetical protein